MYAFIFKSEENITNISHCTMISKNNDIAIKSYKKLNAYIVRVDLPSILCDTGISFPHGSHLRIIIPLDYQYITTPGRSFDRRITGKVWKQVLLHVIQTYALKIKLTTYLLNRGSGFTFSSLN